MINENAEIPRLSPAISRNRFLNEVSLAVEIYIIFCHRSSFGPIENAHIEKIDWFDKTRNAPFSPVASIRTDEVVFSQESLNARPKIIRMGQHIIMAAIQGNKSAVRGYSV